MTASSLARLDQLPASGSYDEAVQLLRVGAVARATGEPLGARLEPLLQGRLALLPRTVELAADSLVTEVAHELLTHGWTPAELHVFAARRLDPRQLSYATDALAATARWDASTPWLPQLRNLRADVWWAPDAPHLGQWARRHGVRRAEAVTTAVEVLSVLCFLPRTDAPLLHIAPPPVLPLHAPRPPIGPLTPVRLVRSIVRRLVGGLGQRPNGRIW